MESTELRIANRVTFVNGKAVKEQPVAKQSFADIYTQWESTHDESRALSKRARDDAQGKAKGPSINEIRRMDAQNELDLHEMKLEEALVATRQFLELCQTRGLRKVRIVTGKGLHSENGEAVLRPAVVALCKNSARVREVLVPKASEGGSGALNVILKVKGQ